MEQTKQTNTEKRRVYYGVANKVGMRINELYADFMVERFPNETHITYMREWAFRFMSGNPASYMDDES
ncbi:unnamed protein product, partial [marine sediment metagenome]